MLKILTATSRCAVVLHLTARSSSTTSPSLACSAEMALTSKQCRVVLPISPAVTPRARTCNNRLVCKAALQPVQNGATRRESLGLLLALPLLLSGQTAQAADLGDFRKVKGTQRLYISASV